jgi:hypothetical protein
MGEDAHWPLIFNRSAQITSPVRGLEQEATPSSETIKRKSPNNKGDDFFGTTLRRDQVT